MKKILKLMLFGMLSFVMLFNVACKDDSDVPGHEEEEVPDEPIDPNHGPSFYIHYHRFDDDYTAWNLWLWIPDGDGAAHAFNGTDAYGVYGRFEYTEFANSSSINFIVRTDAWAKDPDMDRTIVFDDYAKNENGDVHVYLLSGDKTIYKNKKTALSPKITVAEFTDTRKITIQTSALAQSYKLYGNGELIDEGEISNLKFFIFLTSAADVACKYVLDVQFDETTKSSMEIKKEKLYDTSDFISNYTYSGNDLGVTYKKTGSVFKLWAPVSTDITLRIYQNGTPKSVNQTVGDDTFSEHKMTMGEKGVWSATLNGDFAGKYYTYVVTNGDETNEVVDPYAKSTGINGLRGMIVDFATTNPDDWDDVDLEAITSPADLTVYELHVRDLTSDSTWNGKSANKGKYLGLIEENTTYTKDGVTVKTGFDHIKELGVNAVQLLPIFDYKNDSSEDNAPFNWGYNPLNYNTLEGSYSSNPYDGLTRIKEFKQVVAAYANNGIRVIMDVVYNHVNDAQASNFNKIVPGYFFRYDASGNLSNGSGCGNETASERRMMRKFMVDSTTFWASEYKLGGFRFDLMGLHDKTTMENIATATKAVRSDFVVYGEPWNGGTSPLSANIACTSNNIAGLKNVGAFNDKIRDGIKGSVFTAADGAWINSAEISDGDYNDTKSGIAGGVAIDSSAGSVYEDPYRTVNYVSCHDNNTLFDKLTETGVADDIIAQTDVMANAIVLTSQGIAFIHAGEEIMRQKILADGTLDSNSYISDDKVNSIKWDRKVTYLKEFNQYKELISLRKTLGMFNLSAQEIKDSLEFLDEIGTTKLTNETIAYKIIKDNKEILIIHNVGTDKDITLDASYTVKIDISSTYATNATVSNTITLKKNTTIILSK